MYPWTPYSCTLTSHMLLRSQLQSFLVFYHIVTELCLSCSTDWRWQTEYRFGCSQWGLFIKLSHSSVKQGKSKHVTITLDCWISVGSDKVKFSSRVDAVFITTKTCRCKIKYSIFSACTFVVASSTEKRENILILLCNMIHFIYLLLWTLVYCYPHVHCQWNVCTIKF